MLVEVEVRTAQGSLLSIPLDDVSNGIALEEIEGLDPVKATLVSSSFAGLDGEQYHSARRDARNIVFKFGLEPDYVETDVSTIRNRLYDFFMPKSEVNLTFRMDDRPEVHINGRVETCQSPMFTAEPQMDVSLMCFNPDFVDPTPIVHNLMSTSTDIETIIPYSGSVEVGFELTLNVNRNLNEFTIYHRPPDGSLRTMEFAVPLESGDVVSISTIPGSKYVRLNRAGTQSSILYAVSPQSNWIQLFKGENHIRLYSEGAGVPYTIEHITKYGGL